MSLKMAVTRISDEIVCVAYPASSCFSVLAVLNVTTSGSHLPAMLEKYQNLKMKYFKFHKIKIEYLYKVNTVWLKHGIKCRYMRRGLQARASIVLCYN